MQAIVIREFGSPDVLSAQEVATPTPGPGEVRVRVHAVAVMRTRDVAVRSGRHPFSQLITLPHILGGEHAGVIDAVGDVADEHRIGTRVAASSLVTCGACAACRQGHTEACDQARMIGVHLSGAYAEYAIVPSSNVYAIPDDLSYAEAAVMASTGPVARAQVDAAQGAGDGALLVPGVAGALGSTVAAIARYRGIPVIGVERAPLTAVAPEILGVETIIDGASTDLGDQIAQAAAPLGGLAGVVDNLAVGSVWNAYMGVLNLMGRVVVSGAIGEPELPIDPRRLYLRSQSVIGLRTGNRGAIDAFWRDVHDGFRIPAELVAAFPFDAAGDAHRETEAGGKVGHMALTLDAHL